MRKATRHTVMEHRVFRLDRDERQQFLYRFIQDLTLSEKTVLKKITALAGNPERCSVHVIMALSKAAHLEGIDWLCRYVIQSMLSISIARFWHHTDRIREAQACVDDFKIACDAFTKNVPLADAARKRRLVVVVNARTGYCQEKGVPFKFASPLRNRILLFKRRLLDSPLTGQSSRESLPG